jgi:hypothetical protein
MSFAFSMFPNLLSYLGTLELPVDPRVFHMSVRVEAVDIG